MTSQTSASPDARRAALLPLAGLFGLLVLCALAYYQGLGGPFMFDDIPNLVRPLDAWLRGEIGWQEIVRGNNSGLLGRPLSMLSFLGNASVTGLETFPLKATNLAVHLLCGVVLYALLVRLLPRDPWLGPRARLAALLVTGVWLLHPMQVSTVLYIVQRMAQLSSLFVLAGLLVYVHGRQCLESGRPRSALLSLFLGVPALTAAAMLCKENGALLPLFCGVIELGYFRPTAATARPRAAKLFFVLSLLLPGALTLAWYALHPQKLLDGYEGRLFTLGERIMTEPRVLIDYMQTLLVPRGSALGLYTDDFPLSHGLLDPPSTLLAMLALLGLAAAAWTMRVRNPAFFTGIGLYFAGHLLESTVFPLEIYFEHRNYLPSAGFFLAAAGLAALASARLLPMTDHPERTRRWLAFGCGALLLMLGLATWARAGTWTSSEMLATRGLLSHPESVRANIDVTRFLQDQGRVVEVQQLLDKMSGFDNPAARHVAAINSVVLQCSAQRATTPEAVARISAIAGAKLELAELLMMENLVRLLQEQGCQNLDKVQLASIIVRNVDAAPQSPHLTQLWRSRFHAATLYASAGQLAEAQRQLELAWGTGSADPAVGAFLVQVQLARGDVAAARSTLPAVAARVSDWDSRGHAKIAEIEQALAAKAQPPGAKQ